MNKRTFLKVIGLSCVPVTLIDNKISNANQVRFLNASKGTKLIFNTQNLEYKNGNIHIIGSVDMNDVYSFIKYNKIDFPITKKNDVFIFESVDSKNGNYLVIEPTGRLEAKNMVFV